jgi:hypothetical protein
MKLNEIIEAVNKGKIVHWKNEGYRVIKDDQGQFLIECSHNKNVIGLTWSDGVTLNGEEKDFFITEKTYAFINGFNQYPDIPDSVRSQIVKLNFFKEKNGFDIDKISVISNLRPGEVINNLGNLYDTMIVRLK